MTKQSVFSTASLVGDLSQKSDASRCPKCLGAGVIVLVPDLPGQATAETCPICEGTGLRPRRNGYLDYTPSAIGSRSR